MSFTAVVVIHDSEPELRALLGSIDRHLPQAPQLVVADTGSGDGGAQLARERRLPRRPSSTFPRANSASAAASGALPATSTRQRSAGWAAARAAVRAPV